MTSALSRLSRVSAASASLALLIFPVPASGASVDIFLKIPGVPGDSKDSQRKGWIELNSVVWSTQRPGGGTARGGNVEFEWKVEEGESAPPPPGEAEITLKGTAAPLRPKISDVTLKRGTMDGISPETVDNDEKITIHSNRTEAGAAGSDRPMTWDNTKQKKLASLRLPPAQGTFRVKTRSPWPGCRVGTRYPQLQLGAAGRTYTLVGVTVASCSSGAGDADDRPTEEVAFYYNRIR